MTMKYTQFTLERIEETMGPIPEPSCEEMDMVFHLCRSDQWRSVLKMVEVNPWLAVTPMIMDNHIATTIVHQAITSKGDTEDRAILIQKILDKTPQAAAIKNGYGSLPLHVIAQRNTKIDAQTKEKLITQLVKSYTGALVEVGGVGRRTPLHIIFTDYISPKVTKMMIDHGHQACYMQDKKGYLPAHVACSRHCSPEKLRMLLSVYRGSLYEKANEGETLLSLATSTATKSHPNYALIEELRLQLSVGKGPSHLVSNTPNMRFSSVSESSVSSRERVGSNDSTDSWKVQVPIESEHTPYLPAANFSRKRKHWTPENPAALLLHFSQKNAQRVSLDEEDSPIHVAKV
ncbi:predicted protein [Phaeodactylum tricornutum CCAP 1055/1]|uniref:Uncharacterized protein n=1 Tax=Phaeodactylum tricornutum (strain CCAP 1055/1) TaxID=556484 RepID=B5Y5M3_PHATC|nr:predicted protein [Phaeodactylum tricornutum CCAP 1055/1]ACI65680.1 predicted protein [Phaeodactylum tricornutum CCAP 1055/1]|eukprot:XP_002186210.1 predicted protein [Phaeodactylum tricornutum CCAP 1055/1]